MLSVERLIQNMDGIAISKALFQQILAQTNLAGLEIVASEIAKANISFAFDLIGLEPKLSSLDWFMKMILQRWGWFKIEPERSDTNHEMKLFHDYGMRWSLFLKSYLSSVIELVCKARPIITVSDKVVKIRLSEYPLQSATQIATE